MTQKTTGLWNYFRFSLKRARATHEPITRRQILDSSKLKGFADDNFKFDENGIKLSKRVESTVGKGEIARYEQFLLVPQFFERRFPGASKGVIVFLFLLFKPSPLPPTYKNNPKRRHGICNLAYLCKYVLINL